MQIAGKTTTIGNILHNKDSFLIYTGNHINDCKHLFKIIDEGLEDITLQRVTNITHTWVVYKKEFMPFILTYGYTNEELKEILNTPSYNYFEAQALYTQEYDVGSKEIYEELKAKSATAQKTKTGKIMNALDRVKHNNLAAAKSAATIEVGKVLNKTLVSKIRPQLPMMARGYADHAFAEVVVANIASFAVANFASNNEKAVMAADAMMQAAMTEFVSSFNIETIIADMLEGIELPSED